MRKHIWFCWGRQAEGPLVPYPDWHLASVNLTPVSLQFFITIFYISVCNTTEERCERGVCWPHPFLPHANAGTFENAREQQPNRALIKDKIFGDWWLCGRPYSQPCSQPLAGTQSLGSPPYPCSSGAWGAWCLLLGRFVLHFQARNTAVTANLLLAFCHRLVPGVGMMKSFVLEMHFPLAWWLLMRSLCQWIKAAIRMWGPPSWSYNGKPRKPPLSLGAWGAFLVHLWKRLISGEEGHTGTRRNLIQCWKSAPPPRSFLPESMQDWLIFFVNGGKQAFPQKKLPKSPQICHYLIFLSSLLLVVGN